jgi:FkbM family methyltransferase
MSALTSLAKTFLPGYVLHRVLAYRAKSRGHNPELKLLPSLHTGGNFIDVGANIGDYSRVAGLIFKHVYAFEPQPSLVLKLKQELPKNVAVYPYAMSDEEKQSTLYVPYEHGAFITGLGSLDQSAHGDKTTVFTEITVNLRTLDSFNFNNIDVIKIDVEGFEEAALRGAVNTIRLNKPALIVEIEDDHHPGKTRQIFEFMSDEGYRAFYYKDDKLYPVYYDIDDVNRPFPGLYVNNFVFLHMSNTYIFKTYASSPYFVTVNGNVVAEYGGVDDDYTL